MTDYASLLSNNQTAYADVLTKYQDRVSGLKQQADVLGQNQLAQSARYWKNIAGNTYQQAWGSGLNNSTIKNSLMNNVAYQQSLDTNQIMNNVNQQKLALDQQASMDWLSAYERAIGSAQQQRQFDQSLNQGYANMYRQSGYGGPQVGYGSSFQNWGSGGTAGTGDFSASLANWADLNNPGGYGLSLYPGGQHAYAGLMSQFATPYTPVDWPFGQGAGFSYGGSPASYGMSFDPGSDFGGGYSGY